MSHRRAVMLMVLVTLLWSMAGVVSRHLEGARSFEVTFWRSAFNALALAVALTALRGPGLWAGLVRAPRIVWASGLCWAVMYTAFMVALTLTTVANVLVMMALGPLMTALLARLFLAQRQPPRTWLAIVAAGIGIAWMFFRQLDAGVALTGSVVAMAVPLAAAVNWTLLQAAGHRDNAASADDAAAPGMRSAMRRCACGAAMLSWRPANTLTGIFSAGRRSQVSCPRRAPSWRRLPARHAGSSAPSRSIAMPSSTRLCHSAAWPSTFPAPPTASSTAGICFSSKTRVRRR